MSGGGCDCLHKPTGTEQTLDELDWERGIRKKWKKIELGLKCRKWNG